MKSQFLRQFLSIAIILCAGILPYAQTVSYPFHADSITQIADNHKINNPLKIKELWTAYPKPGRFVPFLSFALNYRAGGHDPAGYRVVNIALHTLNGLVLWMLILTIFKSPRLIADPLRDHRHAVALFSALIFLTHPLQTQAVSYVIQRSVLLATLFGLLTMLFYLNGRMAERGAGWMWGACLFGLLAMLSKEIAFAVPLMLILVEFYLLKSGKYSPGAVKSFQLKHLIMLTVYLLIIPASYHFDYESILQSELLSRSHDAETQMLTPGHYFISQYEALLVYLQKIILPVKLSFDHDLPVATAFKGHVLWGLVLFFVMILTALFMHGRSVLTTIGVLGFFVLLSVESTIIPLTDLIQEHRMYLPLSVLTMGLVAWLYTAQKRVVVAHLICAVAVTALGWTAYQRNTVYRDRIALWQDVADKYPHKARARVQIGKILLERGEVAEALAQSRDALRINRDFAPAYAVLSDIYQTLGEKALALRYAGRAAELQPHNRAYAIGYAAALRENGRLKEALALLDRLIGADSVGYREYHLRAMVRHDQGEDLLALADLNRAIHLNPYLIDAYNRRAQYYAHQQKYADAMRDFNVIIEQDPESTLGYNNRALVLEHMKQYELALKDLNRAVQLRPELAVLYVNRGQVFESQGDLARAREDYQKALSLNPVDPSAYMGLAFLDIRSGDWEAARIRLDQAVKTEHDHGIARYHRALYYFQTDLYAEAYQDLMAASREGYKPATEFLPKVTPQISAPPMEKP